MVVLVIAVAVGVIVVGWLFNERAQIRRQLRQAPRGQIRDAAEGQAVRFDGTVAPGQTLRAPLTGRVCVFYVALVEEYVSNGKTGSWRQRVREQRGVPFTLDDGTGRALVDPSGARIDCELDQTSRSGAFDDATPVEEDFLTRHGMRSTGWFFNKKLRYREGAIEIGEHVAVMGRPVREPDPDAIGQMTGYREGPPTRLRLGGSAEHPLVLSDAPPT